MTAVSLLCMFRLLGPTCSPGICHPVDSKAQDPPLPLPLHKISFHSFFMSHPQISHSSKQNHTTKSSTLELGCSLVLSGSGKGTSLLNSEPDFCLNLPCLFWFLPFILEAFPKSLVSPARVLTLKSEAQGIPGV